MRNDVYLLINEEDLTPDLKLISDACGIDFVRNMLREFGGMNFYIPKLTRLDKFVEKYISQNADKSIKEVAKDLNVSEQFLRNLKFGKKQK